jgi:hypothetical protein
MLRIIKGLVVAFVISFLVAVPTISAQAADGGSSDPTITSTVIPVAEQAPTADNPGKPFLTPDEKVEAKRTLELTRQKAIYDWELRSTLIALLIVGCVVGYCFRGAVEKNLQ